MNRTTRPTTNITFNRKKYKELLVHVIDQMQKRDNLGDVILNKILVDCDFTCYTREGKPMTGQRVMRLALGPVSKSFIPITNELIEQGRIAAISTAGGITKGRRYQSLRPADLSMFSEAELAIIKEVIDFWSNLTARQASDESHEKFAGWRFFDDKEDIDYSTAWFSCRPLDEDSKRFALTL